VPQNRLFCHARLGELAADTVARIGVPCALPIRGMSARLPAVAMADLGAELLQRIHQMAPAVGCASVQRELWALNSQVLRANSLRERTRAFSEELNLGSQASTVSQPMNRLLSSHAAYQRVLRGCDLHVLERARSPGGPLPRLSCWAARLSLGRRGGARRRPRISALQFVREWAVLRQEEIRANWERARRNEPLLGIEPLA
jgi:hypothetical protein